MFDYNKFAELCEKRNKSPSAVCHEVEGVSQQTISNWKTGKSTPKLDKIFILAKYFGVPYDYFFKEGVLNISEEPPKGKIYDL